MTDFLISLYLLWPCCYLFYFPNSQLGSNSVPQMLPPIALALRCLRFPACVSQSPFSSGSSSAPVGRQCWGSGTGRTSPSHLESLLLELVLETKPLFWQCLRFWCVCTLLNHLCSTSHPNWHLPSWSPTAAAFVTAHTTSSCWCSPLLVVFVKVTFCGQTFLSLLCQCPQSGAQTPLSWPVSSGVSFLWKGNNDQNSGIISVGSSSVSISQDWKNPIISLWVTRATGLTFVIIHFNNTLCHIVWYITLNCKKFLTDLWSPNDTKFFCLQSLLSLDYLIFAKILPQFS